MAAMERAYSRDTAVPEEQSSESPVARPPNWVDDLITMTRPGAEIEFPSRSLADRVIPFQYDDFS